MLRHLRYEKKAIEKNAEAKLLGSQTLPSRPWNTTVCSSSPSLAQVSVTQYSPLTGNMNIIKLIITDYTMKSQRIRICIIIYIYILIYNICMILYMIIYIPSGHQTWQLKFPNLERGFPTATFDYWRVFDLIWSLMLLRVTPPHRCNNCQRLQIDTDGWWAARLGTFVATAGCDTLGSGSKCEGVQAFRVSRATWRLTKSQTKSQAESNLKKHAACWVCWAEFAKVVISCYIIVWLNFAVLLQNGIRMVYLVCLKGFEVEGILT